MSALLKGCTVSLRTQRDLIGENPRWRPRKSETCSEPHRTGSVSPPTSFFLKILLVFLVPLPFHIYFKTSFSKPAEAWIPHFFCKLISNVPCFIPSFTNSNLLFSNSNLLFFILYKGLLILLIFSKNQYFVSLIYPTNFFILYLIYFHSNLHCFFPSAHFEICSSFSSVSKQKFKLLISNLSFF